MILDETLPDQLAAKLSDEGLAIFLFHGVVTRNRHRVRNYTGKHIEADLFARCMKRLSRAGHALSMDEVLHHYDGRELFPKRAFAVTFDDGFENNLSIAAPILTDVHVPATVYVTSGFIEQNGMSWIDRIEHAVESVQVQSLETDWMDGVVSLGGTDSRIDFLQAVREHVKHTPFCDADAFADALCERLGYSGPLSSDDPLDLKMTWDQVRRLAEGDLFNVGGHGHTHAILAFLDPDQLSCELDTSLAMLFEKAGVGPRHYSYPEGLAHCYSDAVIDALKGRGVRCCPTAINGLNVESTDVFHLTRVMVSGPRSPLDPA